jgi:hypothetical protein
LTADDLRSRGLVTPSDLEGNVGTFIWTLSRGTWRLHLEGTPASRDRSGTYRPEGTGLRFAVRSGRIGCAGVTWTARWTPRGPNLAFTVTSLDVPPSCDERAGGLADGVIAAQFEAHDWTKIG